MFEIPFTGAERYQLRHDIGLHIMQVRINTPTAALFMELRDNLLVQNEFSPVEVYALWQACRPGVLRRALWDCFNRLREEYR